MLMDLYVKDKWKLCLIRNMIKDTPWFYILVNGIIPNIGVST
jgi:hypothetical protein